MKNPERLNAVQESEPQPTPKKPYEAPTATLVPLKPQERLFASCTLETAPGSRLDDSACGVPFGD